MLVLIKWAGTVLCLIGMALTSFNVFPYNIFLSAIGSTCWMTAGLMQKDKALATVDGAAVSLYLLGIINWSLK